MFAYNFDYQEIGTLKKIGMITFASLISEVVSYPLDRIKTKIYAKSTPVKNDYFKLIETKDVIREIYARDGS